MAMEIDTAASLLDQLGNQTRLRIIRMLVRAGEDGVSVGEIQRALGIPASTLSHHLGHLRSSGLVRQEREGTVLHCCVDYGLLRGLVDFLTAECCVDAAAPARRRA